MGKKAGGAGIYLLSWLVPGAGYYLCGFRMKAALLFFLITGAFVSGLLMGGGVFSHTSDFISRASSLGKAGVGLPWLAGLAPGLRYTRILSDFGEIGSCFAAVAGLLNLLAVMGVADIKKG